MKKLVLLLGIILYLVSCKVEEPKFANQSTFLEAETTTIEHVSIPLTNSQWHLYTLMYQPKHTMIYMQK